jgi:hypothetical protein
MVTSVAQCREIERFIGNSTLCDSDDGADKIEITPAMVDAGLKEIWGYRPEDNESEETVTAIFRAMTRAQRESQRQDREVALQSPL